MKKTVNFNVELKGTLLALLCIPLFGLFPIIVKYEVMTLSPMIFASYAAFVASGILFLLLIITKYPVRLLLNFRYQYNLFIIGFFGTFMTSLFFFIGTSLTSGINASILLQVETVYSMILGYFLLKERITIRQIYATFLIIIGTIVVMYNGKFIFRIGDILVLLTPIFWQLSHYKSKLLMRDKNINNIVISFGRTLYGGTLLFILSFFIYPLENFTSVSSIIGLIFFHGIFVYALSFIVWYRVLNLINLSKATALIIPYPVFSIFMAKVLLGEVPTIYQIIGLGIVMVGIYFLAIVRLRDKKYLS